MPSNTGLLFLAVCGLTTSWPAVAVAQNSAADAAESKRESEPSPNPELEAEIARLIQQLDADSFAEREKAQKRLVEIGAAALPKLYQAAESKSPEQRFRARHIIETVGLRDITEQFAALGRMDDDDIDLEQGMWLIARLVDPRADRERITKQLDELTDEVRKRLGPDFHRDAYDPREVVEALRHVLAVEHKLGGARENYSHPDNSSIDRVLATGKGLPILLSHVAVAVGRRLELPIVGIPVPGRYMFMYDGARGPKEWSGEDIIVDPFDEWKTLTPADVALISSTFDPARHQVADTNRAALSRMLTNLASHATVVGEAKTAALARRCQALLEAQSRDELDPQPPERGGEQ